MKKLIIILSIILMTINCSKKEDPCFQTWKISEYCSTPSNCNVVGCQTSTTNETKFKCEDVLNIKENDVVLYRTDGCAKFYRRYIKRIN